MVAIDDNVIIPIIASRRLGLPATVLVGAQLGGIAAGIGLVAATRLFPIAGDVGLAARGAMLAALVLVCVVILLRPRAAH